MRKLVLLVLSCVLILACKEKEQEAVKQESPEIAQNLKVNLYGADFKNVTTLSPAEMGDIYKNLTPGDTINVTFKGPVQAVCKAKGCWMQVDVGAEDPVRIKFKDYGFFVPKDIEQKEVIVHGQAFIAEVPVDEQKHLAQDAGKSETEIAAITNPQRSLAFVADGVKIKE